MIAFYWRQEDMFSVVLKAPPESQLTEDGQRLIIKATSGATIRTLFFVAFDEVGDMWKHMAGVGYQKVKKFFPDEVPDFILYKRDRIIRTIDGQEVLA